MCEKSAVAVMPTGAPRSTTEISARTLTGTSVGMVMVTTIIESALFSVLFRKLPGEPVTLPVSHASKVVSASLNRRAGSWSTWKAVRRRSDSNMDHC